MSPATQTPTAPKTSDPDMVMVLGLPFHRTTLSEALADALTTLEDDHPHYWVTPNMDFATQAYNDDDLRDILFFAHRVLCDGMPLVWMSKLIGAPIPERVAGSDLVLRLFQATTQRPIRFFFFGSDTVTLVRSKKILEHTYSQLEVVGAIAPPHAPISDWDNKHYCELIQKAEPDILLVALGCPKQERWMVTYYQKAGARLTIGVGASLDFITGRQLRAPKWMQKTGLEWLWRMSTDPKRLVKRYTKDFFHLFWVGGKQLRLLKTHGKKLPAPKRPKTSNTSNEAPEVEALNWRGDVDRTRASKIAQPVLWNQPIVCECSEVTFIDSSGLGVLAGITRKAREMGVPFVLLRPSQVITDLLKSMKLERQIPWVYSEAALNEFLNEQNESFSAERYLPDFKTIQVSPVYAIEREKADHFAEEMYERLETMQRSWTLLINLKSVDFIDSYGVSKLVALKRAAKKKGVYLWTEGHQAHVLHTLQLLRLEYMFVKKR